MGWNEYIQELPPKIKLKDQWEKDLIKDVTQEIKLLPSSKILEIGCSNGRWINHLSKIYRSRGFGLDNNKTGFAAPNIRYIYGDAFKTVFNDNTFDFVYSLGFVEHFDVKDRYKLLKEQHRILKVNKKLMILVPYIMYNFEYLFLKIKNYKNLGYGYGHIVKEDELTNSGGGVNWVILSKNQLSKPLNLIGFKNVKAFYQGWFFDRLKIPRLLNHKYFVNNLMIIATKK